MQELPSAFHLSISVINKDKAESRTEKYDKKWNRNLLLKDPLLCNLPLMFSPVLGLEKGSSLKVSSNSNYSVIVWFIWMYLPGNVHPALSKSAASALGILRLYRKQMMVFLKNNNKIKLYPWRMDILGDIVRTPLSQKVQGHLHNLCQLLQQARSCTYICKKVKMLTHKHTPSLCTYTYPSICALRPKHPAVIQKWINLVSYTPETISALLNHSTSKGKQRVSGQADFSCS